MTTKKAITDPLSSSNPFNTEQTRCLARRLIFDLQDENLIGALLLLCHAFTYERDTTEREGMLQEVENVAAPMLRDVDAALTAVKRRQFETVKGSK